MTKGGIYKAIAIQKTQGRPTTNYSKLVIKGPKINGQTGNGEITKTISRGELSNLIEFPSGIFMYPFFHSMEWTINNTLILHLIPESNNSFSFNYAAIELEVVDRIRVLRKVTSPRGSAFRIPIPQHRFKNRHEHYQKNGKLFIKGEEVLGLPPISQYDISFN